MPKISIVIPVYNKEKYIIECMESVLSQTYKDYEIVVINDGSTDNTENLLQFYKSVIRYFYQENKGVAEARNLGILNARGEYISFLDSDDVWLPSKLEKELGLIERDKEIGLVYSNGYIINEKGKKCNINFFQINTPYRKMVLNKLFKNDFIPTSSVLVRKECFQKVGLFNSSLSSAEDYDMWMRISYLYKIDYVDFPLIKYRDNPEGISKNLDNALKGVLKALEKNRKNYFSLKGTSSLVKGYIFKKRYSDVFYNIGRCYLKLDAKKRSRELLLKSIYFYPLAIKPYIFYFLSFLKTEWYLFLRRLYLCVRIKNYQKYEKN